ncbi:hypothetical protein D6Z43_06340 [Pseudomonas sp. DY-1]|nr:hypothetical protein D6Z43_06340 [Pseudomonas sp. DY-1]
MLTHRNSKPNPQTNLTVKLTKSTLDRISMGQLDFPTAIKQGDIKLKGDAQQECACLQAHHSRVTTQSTSKRLRDSVEAPQLHEFLHRRTIRAQAIHRRRAVRMTQRHAAIDQLVLRQLEMPMQALAHHPPGFLHAGRQAALFGQQCQ